MTFGTKISYKIYAIDARANYSKVYFQTVKYPASVTSVSLTRVTTTFEGTKNVYVHILCKHSIISQNALLTNISIVINAKNPVLVRLFK